jgi:hypothetical protein
MSQHEPSELTTNPRVAFILVCWNNQDLLEECFKSIRAQTFDEHVTIMVDNGSKDDSVIYTKQNFPWVHIYEAGANLGFAKGNNVGVKYALQEYPNLEYLVFINTDARMRNDWLSTMLNFADLKPKGALFQSTTLDYYDHSVVDSTHIYLARNGSGTQAGWRTPYIGDQGPRKVFGVNAAVAMISRRFIDAQPFKWLFDETMFMYLEDVDLSARATIMGWDNYLVPGTFGYHMGSASSGKNPGFSLYMTYRNNSALLYKNLPFGMILKMLPGIVRGDLETIRLLRRTGRKEGAKKIIKGRVIGLTRLPLFFVKRQKMLRVRTIPKVYLWQLMNKGY